MSGRGWSFRTRLAALIATVFILAGAVLLVVQYLLVQRLFDQSISTISGCISTTGTGAPSTGIQTQECTLDGAQIRLSSGGGTGDEFAAVIEQTTVISREVLSQLLGWSVVVLIAFAGLAVAAAWWLSRRSLGRIAGITSTTREITREDLHRRLSLPGPDDEIKELADTIDGMLDRLASSFERQEQFIAGASHELRTPLTTTRTLLEIPLAQGRVPADLEREIQKALEANERSERLIAALLVLARGSRPSEPGDLTEVDLAALATELVRERRPDLGALQVAEPAHAIGARARGNRELIRVAVANLVDNAIRHNCDGGELRVSTGSNDEHVWIEVGNDGADLTQADLGALTMPFHRGEATRLRGEGLGLGLALVATVARAHEGTLRLTARPGGGLDARLTLPRSLP